MRCVEGALGLGGHVVIGVVRLAARFHHEVQISFHLDFVVQLVHLQSDCILCSSISSVTKFLHTFVFTHFS